MNNFYTVLVIPEKTKQVKKVVLPAIYVRVGLLLGSVGIFFLAFMVYDYVNVMKQLSENKRLQTENRQLKQQMQTFTTKLQTVQDALERIQSYTTKLRIITNQAGENSEQLKKKVEPNIPGLPMDDHSDLPPAKSIPSGHESSAFKPSRLLALGAEADDLTKARTFEIAEGNTPVAPTPPAPVPPAAAPAAAVPAPAPVPAATAAPAPNPAVTAPVAPPKPVLKKKIVRKPKPVVIKPEVVAEKTLPAATITQTQTQTQTQSPT
ncbi:MAG: hypothetical protein ACXVCK_17490, partial [Bdellovibrionota bacterium]